MEQFAAAAWQRIRATECVINWITEGICVPLFWLLLTTLCSVQLLFPITTTAINLSVSFCHIFIDPLHSSSLAIQLQLLSALYVFGAMFKWWLLRLLSLLSVCCQNSKPLPTFPIHVCKAHIFHRCCWILHPLSVPCTVYIGAHQGGDGVHLSDCTCLPVLHEVWWFLPAYLYCMRSGTVLSAVSVLLTHLLDYLLTCTVWGLIFSGTVLFPVSVSLTHLPDCICFPVLRISICWGKSLVLTFCRLSIMFTCVHCSSLTLSNSSDGFCTPFQCHVQFVLGLIRVEVVYIPEYILSLVLMLYCGGHLKTFSSILKAFLAFLRRLLMSLPASPSYLTVFSPLQICLLYSILPSLTFIDCHWLLFSSGWSSGLSAVQKCWDGFVFSCMFWWVWH